MNRLHELQARVKRHWLAILWAVFLAGVVGAGWYKNEENQRDHRARAAWDDRIAKLQAEGQKEFERLKDFLDAKHASACTRSELESELNGGRPFDLQVQNDRNEVNWSHPKFAIPIRLSFEGDQLNGFSISGGSPRALPENAQPKPKRFDSRAESIRKLALRISVVGWLAALVFYTFGKHARLGANFMLASALVFGTATLVAPLYTIGGVASNDHMFWAIIMYAWGLVALARTWPVAGLKPQFGVGQLLLALTACALLFGLGPFGYFSLAVFAGSGVFLAGLIAFGRRSLV